MATATEGIGNVLNSQLLASVRSFWFSHITNPVAAVLPRMEHLKPWFLGDTEFDEDCANHFAEPLKTLHSLNPSVDAVLAHLRSASPNDWLSTVLLLDQVPRNCYRGPDAHVVFNVFDPLARAVAQRAIELGIPTSADIKYFGCRRIWFYMPLMHSEDIETHNQAVLEYTRMGVEFRALLQQPTAAVNDQDRQCAGILAENEEAAKSFLQTNLEFELKHRDIIARFGRYPHRNIPLGRDMTVEEQDYLDNGGETFSGRG